MKSGSSPRMRGKRWRIATARRPRGLIPAHAGKTRRSARASRRWPAHPRACGENPVMRASSSPSSGSSPRMRGKRDANQVPGGHGGLIPAHAGKTFLSRSISRQSRAHPRACGENERLEYSVTVAIGSSPRMRGKPSFTTSSAIRSRLIPAHAGKTLSA